MGAIPVLKPREVAALLERLGFVGVRQRGRIDSSDMPTGAGQLSPSTLDATSHQRCCGRSRATSGLRSRNYLIAAESLIGGPTSAFSGRAAMAPRAADAARSAARHRGRRDLVAGHAGPRGQAVVGLECDQRGRRRLHDPGEPLAGGGPAGARRLRGHCARRRVRGLRRAGSGRAPVHPGALLGSCPPEAGRGRWTPASGAG